MSETPHEPFFKEAYERKEAEEAELEEFRDEVEVLSIDPKHRGDFSLVKGKFSRKSVALADMYMWRKIEAGGITLSEFEKYKKEFRKTWASPSRQAFMSLIGNKAFAVLGRKQLEEWKKQK